MGNANPLWKEMRVLVIHSMGKAQVPNYIFASLFTGNCSNHTTRVTEGKAETGGKKNHPL